MDPGDLKRIFDIETLSDFADFDQFSILIEDVENVDEDMFYEILDVVDENMLAELIECYFDDIKQGVPDDSVEIYGMLSVTAINFKNRLMQIESHTDKMTFIDELYRFRQWYMEDGQVQCKDLKKNISEEISICEALIRFRAEKLNEGKFEYDFSLCEEFTTDEYLDEMFDEEDEDDDDYDEYSEGLINRDHPVIDDGDYEEDDDEEDEYE